MEDDTDDSGGLAVGRWSITLEVVGTKAALVIQRLSY